MLKNAIKKSLQISIPSLLVSFSIGVTIKEIGTIQQAQEELHKADNQTLVVFDIDGTLTEDFNSWLLFQLYEPEALAQEDATFIRQARTKFEIYRNEKGAENIDELTTASSLLKSKAQLIEPSLTIALINDLQLRGVRVIALTALPAGTFGTIPCGRTWRFETLQKLGINFSSAFAQRQIIFNTLKPQNGGYPMFYNGILFANLLNDKGSVLGEFFNQAAWCPSKVLFFDDLKKNIESVEQKMCEIGIPYQGYWYRAAERLPNPKFDREIAQGQLQHLLRNDEYLCVDEAATIVRATQNARPSSQEYNFSA